MILILYLFRNGNFVHRFSLENLEISSLFRGYYPIFSALGMAHISRSPWASPTTRRGRPLRWPLRRDVPGGLAMVTQKIRRCCCLCGSLQPSFSMPSRRTYPKILQFRCVLPFWGQKKMIKLQDAFWRPCWALFAVFSVRAKSQNTVFLCLWHGKSTSCNMVKTA